MMVDVTERKQAAAALAASEKRFRDFAGVASDWFWETDAEHRFSYFSPSRDISQPDPSSGAIGLTRWAYARADPAEPKWQAHLADLAARRPFRNFEYEYRRPDGSMGVSLINGLPIFGDDGAFLGYRGTATDVTERKRAEAALAESERQLRAALAENRSILASVSDGFVALDNDWRFTFINAAAERMWGRKAADLLGKTIFNVLEVDANNPFHANYLASKRSGEPTNFTAYSELFGKWLEVRGYPHPGGYTLFFHDVSEVRRAHRALLKSMKKLEAARETNARIFESSLDLICITDRAGNFLQVNPGASQQFGFPAEELIGRNASEFIHPDGLETTRGALRAAKRSRSLHTFENRCLRKDGKAVPMHWSVAWSEKEQKYYLIGRDMTERIQAEERLNRSQRLEAVGQLTGGIAHDFNNLLTVIMGNSDMLARALKDQDGLRRRAELNLEAARRAAELTGQLLAFARRQTLAPKAVEPNNLVTGMLELVRRTLGAQIEIALRLDEAPWHCKVDATQLETAILNLALNARDAMPEGGTLTIATSHRTLPPGSNGNGDLAGGDYVVIDVCDTGTGMSPNVLARAFEPFFTTKDIGKGSGLGLAMVYGFVKQSGGHVAIESDPGRGTRVSLFLPRAVEPATSAAQPARRDEAPLPGGAETILVVEDDPAVRELVTESLRRLGYRVLVAGNGSTARNILFGGEKVDLLFTDIMMPGGVTGTQLAAEVEARLPGLPTLFTTGYAEAPELKAGAGRPGVSLLRKPFKTSELALTVRNALHRAA